MRKAKFIRTNLEYWY